ncbi:MAG: hypothetical protein HRO68_04070 [Nitrosopumilus sp.]|nr:hypothetical protein [Nitrosopumilus sp.]
MKPVIIIAFAFILIFVPAQVDAQVSQEKLGIISQGCDIGPPPTPDFDGEFVWAVIPGDYLVWEFAGGGGSDPPVSETLEWVIMGISSDTKSLLIKEFRSPLNTDKCVWKSVIDGVSPDLNILNQKFTR